MKRWKCNSLTILLIIIFSLSISIFAGENTEKMENTGKKQAEKISFDDFKWLVGSWTGEAFGGIFEEVWSPATGGSMCGTFKLMKKDKISFYEIFTITINSGFPELRLKHFNADLTGWEEKDEVVSYPFISRGENEVQFDGLIYRKISDKTIQIILKTKNAEGNLFDEIIDCKRSNN